jgi:hypothetical protein
MATRRRRRPTTGVLIGVAWHETATQSMEDGLR